jgi:putative SOS response-associated peptidase YedK
MCGRYVTGTDEHDWRSWASLLDLFVDTFPTDLPAAFMPTASVPIVRRSETELILDRARWGLAPSWMARPLQQPPQYNVRAETAPRKFKKYFASRRCVLPASGFWLRRDEASNERWFVRVPDQPLFGLAGLWTERELDGATLRSCTILTVEAQAELQRAATLHDRMPVVLAPAAARRWLSADASEAALVELFEEPPPLELVAA